MIRTDNHTHIILADVEAMVAAARANKIQTYSNTEHISQFENVREAVSFGSTHETGRLFRSFKEYRREFSKVAGPESSGITIRMGLEVDFAPRYERTVGDWVNQECWDFLLCSVHELEDGSDIEKAGRKTRGSQEKKSLWEAYLALEKRAIESDFVPFSVLTHPTRMARGMDALPNDLDDLLLDLAWTARRRNKALELNGSDLEFAPEPVGRLARACSRADCRVSLGSDAHYPRDVFRNMETAMTLVERFNLSVL